MSPKQENVWTIRRLSADQLEKRLQEVRDAKPRRTKMVSVKLVPEDVERWHLVAAASGLNFTEWVESVLNFAAESHLGLSEEQRAERLKNTRDSGE